MIVQGEKASTSQSKTLQLFFISYSYSISTA
jgi:hypothetical protein